MKNNNNHLKAIEEIQNITSKMRATVNESIVFNEANDITDDDFGDMANDDEVSSAALNAPENTDTEAPATDGEENREDIGMKELEEVGTIDQIRELTLKGMMRLCKTPEDPEYQALKKIFGMCDKSVDNDIKSQETQKQRM